MTWTRNPENNRWESDAGYLIFPGWEGRFIVCWEAQGVGVQIHEPFESLDAARYFAEGFGGIYHDAQGFAYKLTGKVEQVGGGEYTEPCRIVPRPFASNAARGVRAVYVGVH